MLHSNTDVLIMQGATPKYLMHDTEVSQNMLSPFTDANGQSNMGITESDSNTAIAIASLIVLGRFGLSEPSDSLSACWTQRSYNLGAQALLSSQPSRFSIGTRIPYDHPEDSTPCSHAVQREYQAPFKSLPTKSPCKSNVNNMKKQRNWGSTGQGSMHIWISSVPTTKASGQWPSPAALAARVLWCGLWFQKGSTFFKH